MHKRQLNDLTVSAIGYGAMVLSPGMYGAIDEDRAATALRHALDGGATLVDTADGYGGGHNEELIGRVLRDRRNEVVVATKFGFHVAPDAQLHTVPVGFDFGEVAINCEPRYIRRYAESSMRRLGTDHIDLYYPHFPDPEVPIEDIVGTIGELVDEGWVGHIGLSNIKAEHLRRALTVRPIAAVQVEWSMWRPIQPELLDVCRQEGIGIVAWSPLGAGFLTGTVAEVGEADFRNNMPRFATGNLGANLDRYAPVRDIAKKLDISPAQLALGWLLRQYDRVVPIPGSRTPTHIDENLAAADIELPPEALTRIDRILAETTPLGRPLL